MRGRLLGALAVMLTLPACGRYRDLNSAVARYQPPPVVSARMEPSAEAGGAKALPSEEDDPFFAQRAELEKRAALWRDKIHDSQGESHFMLPPPDLLAKWRDAARDDQQVAEALGHGLTLDSLEVLALFRNPEVRARENEFEGALAGYSQAAELDTILRRYASLTKSVMTGVGGMSNPDPVTLKFPFPGILALKGEIVDQEVKAARESLEAAKRDAVTAIRKAYANLRYSREAQALTRSQLRLLHDLREALSTRYQAGEAGFEDLVKTGIELERIKEDLTSLGEEQGNAETAIRSVLSLPEEVRLGAPAPPGQSVPLPALTALSSLALERRQEIRAKAALVGKAERMVEMAETMIYPGFTTNASLYEPDAVSSVGRPQARGGGQALADSAPAGDSVLLPKTPWYGADDAYLRQAKQEIGALTLEVEALRAGTLLLVREAWSRFDKARREKALYQDRITALSQAGWDTISEGYATGKVPFARMIEAANDWLGARLGLSRARADMLIAQAELEAAVGVSSKQWPAVRQDTHGQASQKQ